MKTKVYILGAGASKPDGVPLMGEFITEGLKQWDGDDNILGGLFKFIQTELKKNISLTGGLPNKEMFEAARYADREIGIEGLLEAAVELKDREAKIAAEHFIFKTIEKTSSQCSCLRKFVANKIKGDLKSDFSIGIVSFNYDILLERSLLFNSLNQKFSYIISSFELPCNRGSYYMKKYKGEIKLFKPHGSLNWALCDKCKNIQHNWSRRYKSVNKSYCNKCGQKGLTHLLVAPVKNKINNDIFKSLWSEAEKFLKEAQEIIVIGYSFREADKKAREKIGEAIGSNLNCPELTIVNPDMIKIYNTILKISDRSRNHFSRIHTFCDLKQFLEN